MEWAKSQGRKTRQLRLVSQMKTLFANLTTPPLPPSHPGTAGGLGALTGPAPGAPVCPRRCSWRGWRRRRPTRPASSPPPAPDCPNPPLRPHQSGRPGLRAEEEEGTAVLEVDDDLDGGQGEDEEGGDDEALRYVRHVQRPPPPALPLLGSHLTQDNWPRCKPTGRPEWAGGMWKTPPLAS